MSHRLLQIESTLKRAIAEVLERGMSDPRIQGLVSVVRVTVSPDLHDAYVFVSVLPDKYQKRTIAGLRHAAGHLHARVCAAVSMKTVPHLDFRLDDSLKKEAEVQAAIRRGARRRPGSDAATAPPPDAPSSDPASPRPTPQESSP